MSGVVLTPVAVAGHAIEAGFDDHDLVTAVAISFAEVPNHDPGARYHPGTGEDSRGLFQINIGGRLLAERYAMFPEIGRDGAELYDPQINAVMAYKIRAKAGNFRDWSTFLDKRYLTFWTAATNAVNAALLGSPVLRRFLLVRSPMEHGPDVAMWQHIVGAPADGLYGPVTRNHTFGWQSDHRDPATGKPLVRDGIVGPRTASAAGWTWKGPGA